MKYYSLSNKVEKTINLHLGIHADWSTTFCASVGTQLVEAAHTHRLVILLDELFALQVVSAVEAVEAVCHGRAEVAARTWSRITHSNTFQKVIV